MSTTTMPRPVASEHTTDDAWYLKVLGWVGGHEAIVLTAAIIDTMPDKTHTDFSLRRQLHTRSGGAAGWYPIPQEVGRYCTGALLRAGVLSTTCTLGYQANQVGRQARLALYQTLIAWSLRHPGVSLQQLIGRPHRRDADRRLPIHVRLPLYQQLHAAGEQFVTLRQVYTATTRHGLSDRRVYTVIRRLCAAGVVTMTDIGSGGRAAAFSPRWRRPAGELLTQLSALPAEDTDAHPPVADLLNQHVVAGMLSKAAAYSARIQTVGTMT